MPQLSFISGISKRAFSLNFVTTPEREMVLDRTRQFVAALLAATVEGRGEIEAVYPLLAENVELLEPHFIKVLRQRARKTFSSAPKEEKLAIARALTDLSRIIWAFPEGDPEIDLEIAIACNQLALEIYNFSEYPKEWATIHNNLAIAYSESCFGDTVQNDIKSYDCYQQAKKVFTCEPFPQRWTKLS